MARSLSPLCHLIIFNMTQDVGRILRFFLGFLYTHRPFCLVELIISLMFV